MGWNQLMGAGRSRGCWLDLPAGCGVYFVHGYHVVPTDAAVIATETDYGRPFVSSIQAATM